MANRLTGGKLDEIVGARLAEGWAYTRIADYLHAEYGAEVSRVSLRNWYPSPTEVAS